jgi:methionyl-tRNA formyltransferase
MYSKYLFVGYRDWAIKSYNETNIDISFVRTTDQLLYEIKNNIELKYIFFIGWSEIIDSHIIQKFDCYCIHPSMLPLYRGGSPIQNQIIDGVIDSGVTMFKMNDKIDAGPIFHQKYLSLKGSLDEIFFRIAYITADLIRTFIFKVENKEPIELFDQNEEKAFFVKRRKPNQSEITIDEIQNSTALQLYNKIRSLDDPYPNCFITCGDGSRLFIKKAYLK